VRAPEDAPAAAPDDAPLAVPDLAPDVEPEAPLAVPADAPLPPLPLPDSAPEPGFCEHAAAIDAAAKPDHNQIFVGLIAKLSLRTALTLTAAASRRIAGRWNGKMCPGTV